MAYEVLTYVRKTKSFYHGLRGSFQKLCVSQEFQQPYNEVQLVNRI